MRGNKDRNLLKTWIFESALPQPISYEAGHMLGIQIFKNQYVRNTWFAYCVLSYVPSCWPVEGHGREMTDDRAQL